MPFTLAHPGFALKVKQKWFKKLSINGLIWGSLVPDYDILFRFTLSRFHIIYLNLASILILVIPLALATSLIFHHGIRNTLINYLPYRFQKKLIRYEHFHYWNFLKSNFSKEIVSIFVAAVIHLLLDIVSHWDAWSMKMLFHIGIYPSKTLMPLYYYFGWYFPQVIITFLGFYFLVSFLGYKFSDIKLVISDVILMPKKKLIYWTVFLVIALIITRLRFYLFGYEGDGFGWHYLIIYATSSLAISFFLTPLLYRIKEKYQ